MHRAWSMPAALAISLALAGCAQNAVRIESASSVALASHSVASGVRAYLGELSQRRRDANVALVASDRSCRWGNSIILQIPETGAKGKAPLCAASAQAVQAGHVAVPLRLRPGPEDAIKLAATEIAAITAYEEALLKAIDEQPSGTFADLQFAVELGRSVSTDLSTLTGANLSFITADQAKAATGLIGLLDTLQQEARRVEDIREVVREQGDRVTTALTALDGQLEALAKLTDANSSLIAEDAYTRAYNAEIDELDFEARKRFVAAIAAASVGAEEANGRIGPLRLAVVKLKEADTDMRNALSGTYTPEMKRKMIALNRQRLLQVLSFLAGLVPA